MDYEHFISEFGRYWASTGWSRTTFNGYSNVARKLRNRGVALPPDLTLEDARAYVTERLAEVPKASTVAFEVKAIRSMGKWAAKHFGQPDVLADLKIPRFDEPGPQLTATAEDVRKLLVACDDARGFESVRDKALVLTFAATGARRSEVAKMKVGDVDLINDVLYLTSTKARQPRKVSIVDAHDALMQYQWMRERHFARQTDAYWLGQAGPLGVEGLGFAIQRRARAAGLPKGFGTHAFRRAIAIDWLRKGGSSVSLMQIAGWTSPAMIARYAKAELQDVAIEEQRRLFAKGPTPRSERVKRWQP